MLPIVDPNRNNNRPAPIPYEHVAAALLWAQMLMPRREFDRLMLGIQGAAAVTGGLISYKIIDTIAKVLPGIYDYIQLAAENKLSYNKNHHPDSQAEADEIVKELRSQRDPHTNPDIQEPNSKKAKTTDTSVSNTPSSAYVTPARPKRKGPVAVEISPDGTILRAPPGSKRRRIEPLEQQLIMADAEMKGNADVKQETVTKISKFPYAYEGIPKQYTTILPYEATGLVTNLSITQGQANSLIQIRMNSIYDIIRNNTAWSSNPNPVADTADGTINTPYWRDYWAQYYEYWTVVECRYKIRVWNTTNVNDRVLGVFWGYTGIQQPPLTISGGTAATDVDLTYDGFRRWKGFKSALVQTAPSDAAARSTPLYSDKYAATIKGVYHPGDGTHEVVEDELAQTWIRGDAVPKEQNNLSIIITRGPMQSITSAMSYRVRIELEYVVQYKDQKEIWQFPRPTVTTNFNKNN